eukprot:8236335-Pyramimonas_sp.AAC.1
MLGSRLRAPQSVRCDDSVTPALVILCVQALDAFDETLLINLMAYQEFKSRGEDWSTKEQQTMDWKVSAEAVEGTAAAPAVCVCACAYDNPGAGCVPTAAMKAKGAETEDLVRAYCSLAASFVK